LSITKLQQAQTLTEKFGQPHLLKFYKQLAPIGQAKLLDEILSVDFELINSLYQKLVLKPLNPIGAARLAPLTPKDWQSCDRHSRQQYHDLGLDLIRAGKVAAVLVAGGQGTRLGHSGPKGLFNLGLPSQKSLFQLQTERLLNLARRTGNSLPWYIMTSAENHRETAEFFHTHANFGYPAEDLFFFPQDQLPVIDQTGKILLTAPDKISLGPNGNGGCFLALEKSGALADMERRGVEWVFLYGIDNALVRICDPGFIGFTAANRFPSASKVVAKTAPPESVGVLCYRNGRPAIIEYTEMPPELTEQRDNAGNLLYGNANIVTHLFRRDFLAQNAGSNLPYHVAHKKIATIDAHGDSIQPEQPNAYKFELFMFDIFPLLTDMAALQVKREEEFAPVKNKEGNDSPETARRLLFGLHRQWLEDAGVAPELLDRNIEISPCLSLAGEGLAPTKIAEFLRKNRGSEVEIK
jgi:UDP-N-acetylglucosamine/UDP-N-acetylgalactosamine diphosphorylase